MDEKAGRPLYQKQVLGPGSPLVANSVLTDQLPNAWLLSSHLIRLPHACYRRMREFL